MTLPLNSFAPMFNEFRSYRGPSLGIFVELS